MQVRALPPAEYTLGGFTMLLGGWNYDEVKAVNLPQKVASAFTSITSELVGADYMPIAYAGSQVVNGINHCIIALQTVVVPNPVKRLVKMIINIDTNGKATLVSVSSLGI